MKNNTLSPLHVFLFSFVLIVQFSCSKDSDLLADYVIQDTTAKNQLVIDDAFFIASTGSVTLDVLANDTFESEEEVIITETSTPSSGTVEINSDNTLTYTPETTEETTEATTEETTEEIVDTFTYTTETVNEDASVSTETGNVTVTISESEDRAPTTGDNVYYVTTTGKASNDGKTELTAWSIRHAFVTAVAGDVVYVKAGDYGAIKLASSKAGTVDNPIKFIGYTTSPGDIFATTGPTFTKDQWQANGQNFNSSVMPMLDWNPVNFKPVSGDTGISIAHSYVEVHNFAVKEYWVGIDVLAPNVTINNCYADRVGDWDPAGNCYNGVSAAGCTNNNGYGIFIHGGADNSVLKNSLVIDAGMISVYIYQADNILIENTECFTVNTGNATDYMFELAETTGSIIRNCYAERTHTLYTAHTSRLLAVKCQANNNLIENFRGSRSKIQVVNADGNTFKNIDISGQYAEFQMYGEADNNVIEDLKIEGGYGISFLGWYGAECGFPVGSNIGSGTNNTFINPIIHDSENSLAGTAIVSFHRQDHRVTADAGINYIIGGTFYNMPRIINANRGGTINFSDCTFSNITVEYDGYNSGSLAGHTYVDHTGIVEATYTNCVFNGNAFADPIGN